MITPAGFCAGASQSHLSCRIESGGCGHGVEYRDAAESFRDAIADLPSAYRRDCGVHLIRAALAHAGDQEVEHAATLGLEALVIGIETGSGQLLTSLAQLDDALAPWNTVPAVADFRTAMKDTILRPA